MYRCAACALGYPCAHMIRLHILHERQINVDELHRHYWYFRSGIQPQKLTTVMRGALKNPPVLFSGRGHPGKDKTTKRLPSNWEQYMPKGTSIEPELAKPWSEHLAEAAP